MAGFKTHNADGTPKTCKFCRVEVWWSTIEGRWFEPGGKELHVCPLKTAHYRNEAAERSQSIRDNRS